MKKITIIIVSLLMLCCLGSVGFMIYRSYFADKPVEAQAVFDKMLAFEEEFKKVPTDFTISSEVEVGDEKNSTFATWDYQNNVGGFQGFCKVVKTDSGYEMTDSNGQVSSYTEQQAVDCGKQLVVNVCAVSAMGFEGKTVEEFADIFAKAATDSLATEAKSYKSQGYQTKEGYTFYLSVKVEIEEKEYSLGMFVEMKDGKYSYVESDTMNAEKEIATMKTSYVYEFDAEKLDLWTAKNA